MLLYITFFFFFFFNDTATTEIYTLSLHDALPILSLGFTGTVFSILFDRARKAIKAIIEGQRFDCFSGPVKQDRKSTRLNSSHGYISYAVFCLKNKAFDCVRADDF